MRAWCGQSQLERRALIHVFQCVGLLVHAIALMKVSREVRAEVGAAPSRIDESFKISRAV